MSNDYLDQLLSKDEVVLIETRQHWVAAVRYVLRPILILLGAIGLLILNQWLDFEGFLDFVNVLVGWIVVILFLVSIIWMPIDLVRWWSRRYVLTNRRVMRMDGVLRKRSFDSSLEQINDIRTEQSFIGRTLGYADLTIYTASDTANEVYAQLLDGLQFKKAVLDAKEGIRNGAPLVVLHDGFVVKGGTNEASMRADGKIKEPAAAAAATTEAEAEAAPSAAPAAAAVVAASTVIEPSGEMPAAVEVAPVAVAEAEVPPAAAPAPVAAAEPEPVAAPALVVEPVAEAVAEAPVETVVETASEPVVGSAAEATDTPAADADDLSR